MSYYSNYCSSISGNSDLGENSDEKYDYQNDLSDYEESYNENDNNEQYYRNYALNHVNYAIEMFKDVKYPFLKYLFITWYLLEIYSIQPQIIISLIDAGILMEDITNPNVKDLLLEIIKGYRMYKTEYDSYYEMHNIMSTMKHTLRMELLLKEYLKTPLDISFIPRLKEIIWHYTEHKTVPKMAMNFVFKCLTNMMKLN